MPQINTSITGLLTGPTEPTFKKSFEEASFYFGLIDEDLCYIMDHPITQLNINLLSKQMPTQMLLAKV